jgi:hypothetical protein
MTALGIVGNLIQVFDGGPGVSTNDQAIFEDDSTSASRTFYLEKACFFREGHDLKHVDEREVF